MECFTLDRADARCHAGHGDYRPQRPGPSRRGGKSVPTPGRRGALSTAEWRSVDWRLYLRDLQEDEALSLATWLAAEGLHVGEFMEIVDRAYAAAPNPERGRSSHFVAQFGRPVARAYARRKRRCAGRTAALEEALVSGALPGDVGRPQELQMAVSPCSQRGQPEDLVRVLRWAMSAAS